MHDDLLSYAMLSDPGQVRQRNEDACAADLGHGVFVVCDGVGGAAGGEVASQLAATTFVARVTAALEAESAVEHGIRDGVQFANQAVHSQSHEKAELYGMATTMVALVFEAARDQEAGGNVAGTVWLANVGDSRCYRLRGGEFEQLTHDHSIVEEQVRSGAITREQAETSPIRNVITRAIGSEAGVKADVQALDGCHGDLYLLASDGLTREMAVQEVAAVLRAGVIAIERADGDAGESALESICVELVGRANQSGGGDNITCLLVRVH